MLITMVWVLHSQIWWFVTVALSSKHGAFQSYKNLLTEGELSTALAALFLP